MQSNWIGKSYGAEIDFVIHGEKSSKNKDEEQRKLRVYTTRPDTIFGVDFMVISPEHELIDVLTSDEQRKAVDEYVEYVKSRSERERMAEKKITGVFTGGYAINRFNNRPIPVWISEYVLAGYGTGAIMAVPCGDERDFKFAQHFNIPITNIIGDFFNGEEANPTKDAKLTNSDFLNGMLMRDAIEVVITNLEQVGDGKRKVNYKMRDAAFSRQRYWGEPFPIVWKDGIAYPLDENELPLELPYVEKYGPGPEGEGPLANVESWTAQQLETNTMPGYAGSSWYFLRYMDPHNEETFCDKKWSDYWNQVDVYVGGTEHAVGHLLYSRMWTKFLFDRGYISFDEPFKRLVNQGMITGKSFFVDTCMYFPKNGNVLDGSICRIASLNSKRYYPEIIWKNNVEYVIAASVEEGLGELRLRNAHRYLDAFNRLTKSEFEKFRKNEEELFTIGVDISVDWEQESKTEHGEPYLTGMVIEKMSKSKRNVENPDDLVNKYGADTFRMYEMFLGPVEQSKPWDTKGIEGVHRFLKKLWRLFYDELKGKVSNEEKATPAELKILHKAIKKIEDDTERFSFNTAVSAFMVCVNELTDAKCHKREVLEALLILLVPYAPHIAEELYKQLGNTTSVLDAAYPTLNEAYLIESTKEYPVSINGRLRTTMVLPLDIQPTEAEAQVLNDEKVKKYIESKPIKKFIFVKGKMINVVI